MRFFRPEIQPPCPLFTPLVSRSASTRYPSLRLGSSYACFDPQHRLVSPGRWASDGRRALSAIASSAIAACAKAPSARISAATQMASMVSHSVPPSRSAPSVWLRIQQDTAWVGGGHGDELHHLARQRAVGERDLAELLERLLDFGRQLRPALRDLQCGQRIDVFANALSWQVWSIPAYFTDGQAPALRFSTCAARFGPAGPLAWCPQPPLHASVWSDGSGRGRLLCRIDVVSYCGVPSAMRHGQLPSNSVSERAMREGLAPRHSRRSGPGSSDIPERGRAEGAGATRTRPASSTATSTPATSPLRHGLLVALP